MCRPLLLFSLSPCSQSRRRWRGKTLSVNIMFRATRPESTRRQPRNTFRRKKNETIAMRALWSTAARRRKVAGLRRRCSPSAEALSDAGSFQRVAFVGSGRAAAPDPSPPLRRWERTEGRGPSHSQRCGTRSQTRRSFPTRSAGPDGHF